VPERITVREAINLFTYESAYGIFKEKEYGSLEPGMTANLVVLQEDPEHVEPSSIKDINVVKTMVKGKFIYSRT
jgi:predicted amidohydrolase YtcJ